MARHLGFGEAAIAAPGTTAGGGDEGAGAGLTPAGTATTAAAFGVFRKRCPAGGETRQQHVHVRQVQRSTGTRGDRQGRAEIETNASCSKVAKTSEGAIIRSAKEPRTNMAEVLKAASRYVVRHQDLVQRSLLTHKQMHEASTPCAAQP